MKKLKFYKWVGQSRQGENSSGIIAATNLAQAKLDLRSQGLIVNTITRQSGTIFTKSNKIKSSHISLFLRKLSTMLNSGLTLVLSLSALAKGEQNLYLRYLILELKLALQNGASLAEAMEAFPEHFSSIIISLVNAGEHSGSLVPMLTKIANFAEKSEARRRKFKQALSYPLVVIALAFLVSLVFIFIVIPQFESLYKDFGAELPGFTRKVISISSNLSYYWPIILITGFIVTFLVYKLRQKNLNFAAKLDSLILKTPLIGPIISTTLVARFLTSLAITSKAGLSFLDSLKTLKGLSSSSLYLSALKTLKHEVEMGQPFHLAMIATGRFPELAVQMVAVGEESGTVDQMLAKISDFYEEELSTNIETFAKLLEPLVMCILGILVGILVVAMYLPIFQLGTKI